MYKNLKINLFLGLITVLLFNSLFMTTPFAQDKQEIVVTINGISSGDKMTHYNNGEELREQKKFPEAIAEYRQVISDGELCGKEADAHYCIGICYLWLSKKDIAKGIFQEVIKTYPNDGEAVAFSNYSMSWIDVQRGNYYEAINRLQKVLDSNVYADAVFCSRALFQIGRIYSSFLQDQKNAEEVFRKLLTDFPDAEITNHPFLEKLKGN
ncbi:tetratricopeptide repeat protein [candidate division KSB1 bacterium]|nr:tetratricopeptide repeat protein [candidate division KSB1 bacterium]